MKEFFRIPLLCTITLLGACTVDVPEPEVPYNPASPVRFVTTDVSTRGAIVDSVSRMTTMGVFCSWTNTTDWTTAASLGKMFNQQLNYTASEWEYPTGQEVYWGATSLAERFTFFAYAPYGSGAYDASGNPSGNGLTVNGSASSTGIPTLTYTVPAKVENQPDLMVAVPNKNMRPTGAAVSLPMQHALTCVAFQIAGDGDKVSGIAITGLSVSGTLTLDGDNIAWSGLGAATTTDFSASLNYDAGQTYYTTSETMSTNLIAGDGYLMMIPQTLTSDAKVVVTMSDGSTKELALGTATWTAGQRITYNITMPASVVPAPDGSVYAPPGVIGYIKGTNTLTLKGSVEWNYGGEDEEFGVSFSTVKNYADTYFGGLSDSTVYVAYFKFGSLVALSGYGGDFGSEDVVAAPSEWKGSLQGARNYIGSDWTNIPAYTTDDYAAGNTNVSASTYHNAENFALGKGDPCMYFFGEEYGGGWVLPTSNSFGSGVASEGFGGNDVLLPPGTMTSIGGDEVYLPLAGYRDDTNGELTDSDGFSAQGIYWFSTAYNGSSGNTIQISFLNNNMSSSYSSSNEGIPIRCIPNSNPRIFVSPTTATFAAAGRTKTFTVTITNFSGTVGVSQTDGTSSWLTTTLSGSTLSVTAAANTASTERTATITLTADTATAKLTVSQYTVAELEGGQADIVYYDTSDNNRLKVGRWGKDVTSISNMVLTQFGSVIGFNNVGTWDRTNSIVFNPTSTASYAWYSIPYYNAYNSTNPAKSPLVSDASYHNGTNIQAGRGDICKLVGLTSAEAQAMSTAELDAYKSGWRLPTLQENNMFVGTTPDDISGLGTSSGYYTWTDGSTSDPTNPGISTFPKNKYYITGSNDVSLPAAGYRMYNNGAITSVGRYGNYWSGTPSGTMYAYYLWANSSNVSSSHNDPSYGYAVRCISTGETPTPLPPTITVSPTTATFAAAGETKTFTVTTTNYSGSVGVSLTDGTSSWLTPTLNGSTLSLTAAANTGAERTSTITLTAGSATTKLIVSQYEYVDLEGGQADILYFDTSDGNRLKIGRWGKEVTSVSNMVFTRFGGVIGFTNAGSWDSTNSIVFNPTTTTSYGYTSIPNYNAWNTTEDDSPLVSDAAYHNGTNIKAGRGDICKLVGLTSAEAQAMSAAELDAYQSGWRLPTMQENRMFIGVAPDNTTSSYNTSSGYYTSTTGSTSDPTNPNIGTFPKNKYYISGSNDVSLPSTGYRNSTSGVLLNGGTYGYYWSATPVSATYGYSMQFLSGSVYPAYTYYVDGDGFAVRCFPVSVPTISVSPTTATFAAAGETKTFTVTTTNFSGSVGVSLTDGTSSWLTPTLNGSTLSLTAAANTGTERTSTVTLTAGSATTKLIVSQYEYVDLEGGQADILYFDTADSNRLKIGRWGSEVTSISNMVLTQFGSVIGFTNVGTWDSTNSILFNPTSTASYDYGSIPNYNAWNTSVDDSPLVSDATYHNGTNIQAGRGDICKLVGLTSAQAQSMTAAQLDAYKSGWRLPTLQENRMFIGVEPDNATSEFTSLNGYITLTAGSTTDPTNPNTGTFPKNKHYSAGSNGATLPATGYRDAYGGLLGYVGTYGLYRSATPSSATGSYYLYFYSGTVFPGENTSPGYGQAVRCISTGETPTPLPPSITVSPTTATFAAAGETKTFTVTTTNYSGSVDVSLTDGTSSWLTPTLNGSTLSLTAAANTGAERTSTITLTAGSATTKLIVSQDAAPVVPDGALFAPPGVIGYIKGTNTLTLKGSKEYKKYTTVDSNSDGIGDIEQYAIDTFGGLSDSTVYVAYFKFNSLVAISCDPDDTNADINASYIQSNDIVAAPDEWKGSLQGAKDYIDSNWNKIPYPQSATFVSDPANGFGDPCSYYTDYFGSGWKTPTGNPYNGYAESDLTWNSSLGISVPGIIEGVFSGKSGESGVFYPAIGSRNISDGRIDGVGADGCYWSDTPSSATDGYYLFCAAGGSNLIPAFERDSGFAVRCVPAPAPTISVSPTTATFAAAGETKTFTVTTTNFSGSVGVSLTDGTSSWLTYTLNGSTLSLTAAANTGAERTSTVTLTAGTATTKLIVAQDGAPVIEPNLAAPGVIGYIKGTNTLTLKGSKEYTNNPDIKQYAINNFGGLENETVYVAFFKYGSLIALSSDPDDQTADANGKYLQSDDIIAGPSEWSDYTAFKASPVWDDIPYSTSNSTALLDAEHGRGDPCIYYFGQQWSTPSSYLTSDDDPIYDSSNLKWYNAGAVGTGISAGALSTRTGQTGMYYPATGHRHSDGYIMSLGAEGGYWSTQSSSGPEANSLYFTNSQVFSDTMSEIYLGLPIRCVPNTITLSVDTNPINVASGTSSGNTLTVTTNNTGGWVATTTTSWITLTNASGDTYDKVRFDVNEANPTSSERTGTITVTGGSGSPSTTVTVTQAAGGLSEPEPQPVSDGYVIAPPGVIGYIKGTNTLTLRGSKEYASDPDIAAYATQIDSRGLETETVYVAYFRYGSLVALSSDPRDTTAVNGKYVQTNDIVAAPSIADGYIGINALKSAVDAQTSSIDAWAQIPVMQNAGFGAPLVTNIPAGLGDPCNYYFGDGKEDSWSLPWTEGNTMNFPPSLQPSHYVDASDPLPAGWKGGTGGTEPGMFYPLAGGRQSAGGYSYNQGSYGYYWTSKTQQNGEAHVLMCIKNTFANPQQLLPYTVATAIRCAKPPLIKVSPTTAGSFAAGGETKVFTVTTYNFSDTPTVTVLGNVISGNTWFTSTLDGSMLSITVTANASTTERTGTVTISAGNASSGTAGTVTLIIKQAGGGLSEPEPFEPIITVDPTTATFTAGGETKTFTVETAHFVGDVEVTQTSGTASWLTPTLNGSTLSVVAAANTAPTSRSATVTLTAGTTTTKLIVSQDAGPEPNLAPPGVIGYIKGTNTLTLRGSREYANNNEIKQYAIDNFGGLENETVYVAFFKFGSLVAISSDLTDVDADVNGFYFQSDDIIAAPNEWKGSLQGARDYIGSEWINIPSPRGNTTFSDDPANGLGDPCSYYANYFGSGWKTPTDTFYGDYSESNLTWKAAGALGTGIPAGLLSGKSGERGVFYPATGYRDVSPGSLLGVGSEVSLWSNRSNSIGGGYGLIYEEGSVHFGSMNRTCGFAVRCISTGETPTPQPTITVSPTTATFAAAGETKTFTVTTTNFTGTPTVTKSGDSSDTSASWITTASVSGTTLTVTAAANTAPIVRSGAITLSVGTASAVILVSQDPAPPTITVNPTTATFVAAGETKTFTVTTTNFPGSVGVSLTDGTSSWLTYTINGSTLSLTAAANTAATAERTSTVTLTAGSATTKIIVSQNPDLEGGENHVLYFDGGTIKVGRWDTSLTAEDEALGVVRLTDADRSKLAFFKFGSVIGFDLSGTVSGSMTAIQFNPSSLTVGSGGDITGYGNNSTTLPAIPGFTSDDYNTNGIRNVSDRVNYHTEANLRAGKGDPCMLAGIDMTKLSEPDYLATYDSGWRLPTNEENRMFIGNQPTDGTSRNVDQSYDGTVYYQLSPASGWSSSTPGTGIFPANTAREEDPRLPAAGSRNLSNGSVSYQGSYGYYWSSTALSSSLGCHMRFDSSYVTPSTSYSYALGYSVRCVRD